MENQLTILRCSTFVSRPILLAIALLALAGGGAGFGGESQNARYGGTVVDEQGRPVPDATVKCYRYRSFSGWFANRAQKPELETQTATDRKGGFAISAPPGAIIVVVEKPGFAPAWKDWNANLPTSSGPLVLSAPTTLSGVVVDEQGRPVADAEVWVADASVGELNGVAQMDNVFGELARAYFSARTSTDGSFRIENFPEDGHAALAVRKAGLAHYAIGGNSGWRSITSGQSGIELELGPGGVVEGKVIDQATGNPIAGAEVSLLSSQWQEPVESGADGTFSFSDVAPGSYTITAAFPGEPAPDWILAPTNTSFALTKGEIIRDRNIYATTGALVEVAVVVTNTGQPVVNAAVSGYSQPAYTDNKGVAWLRALAGTNWFSVCRSDWSPQSRTAGIEAGITNHVRIEMVPPPVMNGVIRDASGAPASGVLVSFHPGQYPMAPFYEETKTDKRGHYEMVLRQDSQNFVAWDGPINPTNFVMARDLKRNLAAIVEFATSDINMAGVGKIPTNLDMTLQPGITLSGSVKDIKGAPVTDATLNLCIQSGNFFGNLEPKPARVDGRGEFSFPALPQGRNYFISSATAKGYGAAFANLQTTNTLTDHYEFPALALEKADRVLAGQVLDLDGKPVPGATVNLSGKGQPEWPTAMTDLKGHFVFNDMCEGKVSLYAYAYIGDVPGYGVSMSSGGGAGNQAHAGDTNIVINIYPQNGGDAPLKRAAQAGDRNAVKLLLAEAANVNARGLVEGTALLEAAKGGYKEIVEMLLTNGADVNARDTGGNTPLHFAAQNGFKDVAQILVKHGADIQATNNAGQTPLQAVETEIRGPAGATGTPAAKIYTARLPGRKDVADWLRKEGGME